MLPVIESNNNTVETSNTLPSYKLHLCFKIYMLFACCSIIAILIYGITHPNKYPTKKINYFYVIFIMSLLFPALCYIIYLQCKCNKNYCIL
jgi:hypothetical protein